MVVCCTACYFASRFPNAPVSRPWDGAYGQIAEDENVADEPDHARTALFVCSLLLATCCNRCLLLSLSPITGRTCHFRTRLSALRLDYDFARTPSGLLATHFVSLIVQSKSHHPFAGAPAGLVTTHVTSCIVQSDHAFRSLSQLRSLDMAPSSDALKAIKLSNQLERKTLEDVREVLPGLLDDLISGTHNCDAVIQQLEGECNTVGSLSALEWSKR